MLASKSLGINPESFISQDSLKMKSSNRSSAPRDSSAHVGVSGKLIEKGGMCH